MADSYKMTLRCKNCTCVEQNVEIKSGTTVEEHIKKATCRTCGCATLERS